MQFRMPATFLIVAALALSGCESKQAKVIRLKKVADDLETQYRKECFDPFKPESADAVKDALHGTAPSPQQHAAALQQERDEQLRMESSHCQDLEARKTLAGQQWNSAFNEATR